MTGAEATDVDWEAAGQAPRKRRVPPWALWTCGSGCLLFVIALMVVAIPLVKMGLDAKDPEKAWPAVAEFLPYDQRPEGWTAEGANMPFVDMAHFILRPPPGQPGELRVQWFGDARVLVHALDPEAPQNKGFLEVVQVLEPTSGTIELQGREVPCLRFRAKEPGVSDPEGQPTLRFDATGKGPKPVLIEVRVSGEDPVPDERVQALLQPFDLWRGR